VPLLPQPGDYCLTIRQPWCALVLAGEKQIENRSWHCPARVIGSRIWLHAAARPDALSHADRRRWRDALAALPVPWPTGALLGSVVVADCLPCADLPAQLRARPDAHGPLCWIFAAPESLPVPVPARGRLGLWKWAG